MLWNNHYGLEKSHAFLSASRYHWVNYDDDRLADVYANYQATLIGTQLHSFAAEAIRLKQRLPKSRKTLNMYVNDAIGFKLDPEVLLYYSENSYGTADAISFRNGSLRIHDLKTGVTPASMKQLEVYAALFCLEYEENPSEISMELRLYQSNEILIHEPLPENIKYIMDKIIHFDRVIQKFNGG